MKFSSISVVIPCYKEAEVIENTILTIDSYLKERFEMFEIITVIDGSPDKTLENIENTGKKHPQIPLKVIKFKKNRGKGAAVREGVFASQYDPILFIDADLTIPISELEKFLEALSSSDIAIGSRLASGSVFEEKNSLFRFVLARIFHILQILFLKNFEHSDTQCGFKLFRREKALKLFHMSTINRFAFDAELLFLARKMNLRVTPLPVTIKKDLRNTNVHPFLDPVNMFFALIKIRMNDLLGYYRIRK